MGKLYIKGTNEESAPGLTNVLLAENEWAKKRIAALEAENAALREAVAVSKKNEYRGMTRELIAVVRQILRDIPDPMTNEGYCMNCQSRLREAIERMDITYAALVAAGLMENTDGTD